MTALPNPFLNSAAHVPVASGSAGATPCPQPRAPAAQIQVSDGVPKSSLPSGEADPSVTLDCAPSESGIDEEYRCPGGQVVDAAGCELCGPISNADCPYWPDEIQSSCGGVESRHAGNVTQATGSAVPSVPPSQGDTISPMVLPAAEVAIGPQDSVSDGAFCTSPPKREMEPSATAALEPSETEGAVSRAASSDKINESSIAMEVPSEVPASAPTKNPDAGALGTDHIHEIFAGAQRLPPRELPPDFQERLLAAIESDVWADEPPLFLQKREA